MVNWSVPTCLGKAISIRTVATEVVQNIEVTGRGHDNGEYC